jgi:catechol 2,3-dioxygenase-like lactoylglutathione lyase family enzyme
MRARMHHAHLFASDLDASLAFYRTWFDAEVVADTSFGGARNVLVAVGDGRLNFYDQPPRGRGPSAVHHLGFQIEGLAGLAKRLIDAGHARPDSLRMLDELDYLMVEAPDGVLLELFEHKNAAGQTAGEAGWFAWPEP